MKRAIRRIDRALKRLYNLGEGLRAEDFLLGTPPAGAKPSQGAVYVRQDTEADLSVGIFLSEPVRGTLRGFKRWQGRAWTVAQTNAFSVAAEEVSHFHYLVDRVGQGRGTSQLELEFQGEVDKFLLAYFARSSGKEPASAMEMFEELYSQLFERYRWSETADETQRQRYEEATALAGRFVRRCAALLIRPASYDQLFSLLRRFYRLGSSEKIGFLRK